MVSVLNNLNFWTVDYSYLEFRMLLNHIPSMNQERILETVANSLIKRVQQQTLNWVSYDSEPYSGLPTHVEFSPNDPAWLLPCIVSQFKLLKNHIAKQACEMLKSIKSFTRMRNVEEKERNLLQNTAILAHGPFFALLKQCLLECLDFPDTVNEQIEAFIQDVKEVEDRVPDNLPTRHIIHECLTLRLVLIGHRMTLCSETEFAFRWVPTLAQLIIYGLCDVDSNQGLYLMVLDMLNNLLHILLERFGPTSKNYLGVIKKIRKEIADRPATPGVELIRPFLLVSKNAPNSYLYTVASVSADQKKSKSGGDSGKPKSGHSAGNDNSVGPGIKSYSRKHGYLVTKRDAAGQAEIHDNSKQHLLYSMYGAVFYEETLTPSFDLADANLLVNHEHFTCMRRHGNSYLEPPMGSRLNSALDKLSERTARMEVAVAAAAKPPEVKLEPDSGSKGISRPSKPAPPTSLLILANRSEYMPASATMGGLVSPMGCGKVPFSQTIGAQHPYSGLISPNRALPLTPRALGPRSSVDAFGQMRPMSTAQNANRNLVRPLVQDPCQARPPIRTAAGPMTFHQMAPGSMPPNRMPNPAMTDFPGMMQAQQQHAMKASHGPGRPPGANTSSNSSKSNSQRTFLFFFD
ncbi:Mediator of RNA polymerase II transcription subunit 12 [Cichlidogyrus casuarinus]|uniref:Mediator of RNA polymerase II transcription subunit 12 n=1 Tax=Cichlidogyrus casuarinus TaxID=1844966 RepID=A0ABD2QAN4_9PLAT